MSLSFPLFSLPFLPGTPDLEAVLRVWAGTVERLLEFPAIRSGEHVGAFTELMRDILVRETNDAHLLRNALLDWKARRPDIAHGAYQYFPFPDLCADAPLDRQLDMIFGNRIGSRLLEKVPFLPLPSLPSYTLH